jgi:hypothetical protein
MSKFYVCTNSFHEKKNRVVCKKKSKFGLKNVFLEMFFGLSEDTEKVGFPQN